MNHSEPLVSVVTPVYNTDAYLAQCIESVLAQTHRHFEYIVLDNASTDRSLEIARSFAATDSRIRIIACNAHLSQVENYNRALATIDPASQYVKVVQADDWLMPRCVAEMVRVAEARPQVGIVGALHLLAGGAAVGAEGLKYPCEEIAGRDIIRRELLEDAFHVLGTPSTLLFRADVVRARTPFFPVDSINFDLAVGFEVLQHWDFGFVHQVLVSLRDGEDTISARLEAIDVYAVEELVNLRRYGPSVLAEDEMRVRRSQLERAFRRMIGLSWIRRRTADFWAFQRRAARDAAIEVSAWFIARSVLEVAGEAVAHPGRTWAALRRG